MASNRITWEPPESRKEIEHSGLIEKFIEYYVVKEIFPNPNPFLLRADIRKRNYLPGKGDIPNFEEVALRPSGNLSLQFNPRCDLVKYEIEICGKSSSDLVTEEKIRIGKIYHDRFFTSEKSSELNRFCFSPSSNANLLFKNPYASDIVQLVYNPNYNYEGYRKQVFVEETGQIVLVKNK